MARGRGAGLPAFNAYMRRLLGRKPTQAEIAAAITLAESNPISGKQDQFDILGAVYNRAGVDGGIDLRAYDGIAYRKGSGVGSGHFSKITAKNLKPLVEKYESWEAGKGAPSHNKTHYFHPSAMRAIHARNPRMVRSSKWKTITTPAGEVTSPMPSWLNKDEIYFSGDNKHVGLFTTPSEYAGKVRTITSAEAQYPAPPLPGQNRLTTGEMYADTLRGVEAQKAADANPMNIAPKMPDTSVPLPQMAPPPGASTSVPMPQFAPKKHDWGSVASAPDEGAYGAVLAEATKPVVDPNAATKGVPVSKDALAEVLRSKDLAQPGPPSRQYGDKPKERGWANEDLSAPPAPPPNVPLPVTSGPTPPALRPDQTSDWKTWQHGQMLGALNTGPKYYVPGPNAPKPVTPFNMSLSNLLGGFKIF